MRNTHGNLHLLHKHTQTNRHYIEVVRHKQEKMFRTLDGHYDSVDLCLRQKLAIAEIAYAEKWKSRRIYF